MTIKLERICPHCGCHLVIRDGQYGEFLACPQFPRCKYTEPLQGVRELAIYKPPSPYCDKCNQTGLLPFIKNSKVIPYAFVYCDCYHEELEHYKPTRPESLYDFPCSPTFRAYDAWWNEGLYLPALEQPKPEPIYQDTEWSSRQFDKVEQLRLEVLHYQKKVIELTKTKTRKDRL